MTDEQTVPNRGRQIRLEPLLPGVWGVILGVGVGVLAPLGGFLIGSILGPGDNRVSPLAISLMVGIVIGGLGLMAAMLSGLRLVRHRRSAPTP